MSQTLLLNRKIEWILRAVIAVIILQTLRFKFLAHPDSVALFSEVSTFITGDAGIEALIRIGTGIIELIAGILLFTPRYLYGAILAAGTMFGAIKTHLFIIGISFHNDGGALFAAATITLLASLAIIFNHRKALPVVGKFFK